MSKKEHKRSPKGQKSHIKKSDICSIIAIDKDQIRAHKARGLKIAYEWIDGKK